MTGHAGSSTPPQSTYPSRRPARATACFSVTAAAEPSVMPRVMQEFAKLGLVPARWHSAVAGPGAAELHIDLQVADMDTARAAHVADRLRRLVGVERVLTAEKAAARTA